MLISEIMTRDVFTVPIDTTVQEALNRAAAREVHHLLITEHGRLRGVVCICQLREYSGMRPVRDAVLRSPEVLWPQITLREAARRFIDKQLSCFPVCDGADLVGVVTRGDLRRSLVREDELPSSFRCTFCGSTRHVRPMRRQPGLAICLDCNDHAAPAQEGLFEEGYKD